MTTLTIQVEDASILSSLKKILSALDGVSIVKTTKSSKKDGNITETSGYKEAMEDKKCGRVSGPYNTPEDLFNHLGI